MRGMGSVSSSLHELDLVALDQRVREQLVAQARSSSARARRRPRLELEVEHAADPRLVDREAEVPQRALHRLALRVEDPGLRPDEHGRLHASTTPGSARYASKAIPVSRSNAST